ncbi:MAG: DUF1570 domain-containing protein [Opitutaceae bacterium]|nr:DUF1570 domain-containing protein [Opitutaceae bacterium]
MRWFATLAGRLRLLLQVSLFAFVVPSASAKAAWITAEAGNFEVFSSASEERTHQILQDLVDFRSTLLRFMKLPPGFEPRCTVVVFGDAREFEAYKPLFNGKPKDVAGFFTGGTDMVMIALSPGRDEESVRRLVYHEYMHQLLFSRGISLPLWLNEGLAEYFSTFAVKKNRVLLGRAIEGHVAFLNWAKPMPLPELFAVQEGSADYNEGIRQGIFYAESWALVHYLMSGRNSEYPKALNKYLQVLMVHGRHRDPGFAAVTGIDVALLERELRKYLRSGRYNLYELEGALRPTENALPVEFRAAPEMEKDCALWQLRWLSQRDAVCNYELLSLSKRMPDSPRPFEALGGNAWRSEEPDQALEYWAKAAARGSRNAFIHTQLARTPVEAMLHYLDLSYRLPAAKCDELRDLLVKALAIEPDYGDALTLLAIVEAFAENPRPANINLVQRGTAKIRDPRRFHLALAIIRWRFGDHATCRKLVDGLLKVAKDDSVLMTMAQRLDEELNENVPAENRGE